MIKHGYKIFRMNYCHHKLISYCSPTVLIYNRHEWNKRPDDENLYGPIAVFTNFDSAYDFALTNDAIYYFPYDVTILQVSYIQSVQTLLYDKNGFITYSPENTELADSILIH